MTANTMRAMTPVANGTGLMTSVAARTSLSVWARSSPVGWARWKSRGTSRYRSEMVRRHRACTRKAVSPAQ